MKGCVLKFVVCVLIVFGGCWLLSEKYEREIPLSADYEEAIFSIEFEYKDGFSFGKSCNHPLILRNVLDYGQNNNCKNNDSDTCIRYIKQRMLDYWGDRIIEALPRNHISSHRINNYYQTRRMTLDSYFNDREFEDYLVHTLHQLGKRDEYHKFLSFINDSNTQTDRINNSRNKNNIYSILRSNPDWTHTGSQFFIAKSTHSGSKLHFAFGVSVFAMLAGRKRWLLLHPAYLKQANCHMGLTGIYGDCEPSDYSPPHANVSIDQYVDNLVNNLGIPKSAIIDVVLNPGDLLVNCPLWPHCTENLKDTTIGYSFRGMQKKFDISTYLVSNIISGSIQSIKTKLFHNDWDKFTLIDGFFGPAFERLDIDDRFGGRSFINSKNNGKKPQNSKKEL